MCLAIPARVIELQDNHMAQVDIVGVSRVISLDLVESANPGDWVLVHAGFAIQLIDEEYAKETLELLKTLPFFDEEPLLAEGA